MEQRETVVVALMRHDGKILLVPQQGLDDSESVWMLPGGRAEHGELLSETLTREVREKIGLEITSLDDMVCLAQRDNPAQGGTATVFVFAVSDRHETITNIDPDSVGSEARFVDGSEALTRLQAFPLRFMREPIVAYLEGRTPLGTVWLYRLDRQGEDDLVCMVVGSGPAVSRALNRSVGDERAVPSFQASMFAIGCMGILFLLGIILMIGIISAVH